MKKELQIPHAVGFCKKCFRPRRMNSVYCGECQNEPERMKIYQDNRDEFPLLEKVVKFFNLNIKDLENIVFTYGDTFYCDKELSFGLIAHELTHVFQQTKIGKDIWWSRYFRDTKFRLDQEIEAYRQQYKSLKNNNPVKAELELTRISGDLSGKIYGNIISFDDAKNLIK